MSLEHSNAAECALSCALPEHALPRHPLRSKEAMMALGRTLLTVGIILTLPTTVLAQGSNDNDRNTARVSSPVHADVSRPLRDITPIPPPTDRWLPDEPKMPEGINRAPAAPPGLPPSPHVLQNWSGARAMVPPDMNFEGLGDGVSGFTVSVAPPDTDGDVGPDHYVQWVNTSYAIFDKHTGAMVPGGEPAAGRTIWSGFGGPCQNDNDGDPIVLYDQLADRWVMTQFAVTTGNYECIAISQTSDPLGAYNRYAYEFSNFPDYPKVGVWPDAYYITYNMFNPTTMGWVGGEACAYDREKMLAGDPTATQQCFGPYASYGSMLPADLDGNTLPPDGAPNYTLSKEGVNASASNLLFWEFSVDWDTPGNSTFTGPVSIPVSTFTPACSGGACIDQPGSSTELDSLASRLMFRLAYRNYGTHESLVVNHSVNVSGISGIRWYEIRDPGGTRNVFQQGTYAPSDSVHRWMGSIAMDAVGNLAVGYSASSSSIDPSIRYAGRLAGDASGQLAQGEAEIIAGTGSQTIYGTPSRPLERWGDYSSMTLDPEDDCTFWYTQEYLTEDGVFNWHTRIASFRFPDCQSCSAVEPSDVSASANGHNRIDVSWTASSSAADYRVYRSTTSGGPYTHIGSVAHPGTTYSDTPVTGGVTYFYVVRSYTDCESDDSNEDSAITTGTCETPPEFAGIVAAQDRDPCDDSGAVVSWNEPASWNDGGGTRALRVFRDGAMISESLSEDTTSWVDTTGDNDTAYDYSVVAFNGDGCSAGDGVSIVAIDKIGTAPTFVGLQSVDVMPGDVCGLHLSWDAATSNCVSGSSLVYNIYQSEDPGFTPGPSNLMASCVVDLFYEDSPVPGGIDQYYVVRAEDSSVGHGGPCNDGFEDDNSDRKMGLVSSGSQVVTVYSDDFDGNATPSDLWGTGYAFPNPYTSGTSCNDGDDPNPYNDDWHLPETGACTSNSAASNDGASNPAYTPLNSGLLVLGNPPSAGPPYTDGGLVLPANATSITLSFNHDYDFEANKDGGRVMISVDNWPTFSAINPVGGYPSTISTNARKCHPWPGASAYSGDSSGCVSAEFDLSTYAGSRVWFAWNHGADNKDTADDGWYIDDVLIEATVPGSSCEPAPYPVQYFTATATSGQVRLEWVNPAAGSYNQTHICRSTTDFPDPVSCSPIITQSAGLGTYDTATDTAVSDNNTYYYTAFVEDSGNRFSPRSTVSAFPFPTGGKIKWGYHSGATALAPNGIMPGEIGSGATYAVSNDRVLHAMNPYDATPPSPELTGGEWPRAEQYSWTPMAMDGPAQARPPIVPIPLGGATAVAFLGAEDGRVYAVDAHNGALLWQSPVLSNILLASPTGVVTAYGAAYDLLFVGSRDAGSANAMYALNIADGTQAWTTPFDNGGGADAIGVISATAWADSDSNRLFFTSREHPTGSKNTLWCISFDDTGGTLLWARALGDIDGRVRLYQNRLYVGNNSGVVFAVDPDDGHTIWSRATGDGPVKNFVMMGFGNLPGRKLYLSTTNSVWALIDNDSSASLAWRQTGVPGPSAPLAPANADQLYVGSSDGRLYQMNSADGQGLFGLTLGDGNATVGSPALDVINNLAYVGTESGAVYAIELPLQ